MPFADGVAPLDGSKENGYPRGDDQIDWQGKTLRIGHMGDHSEDSLAEMLALAGDAIATLR